MKIILKSYTELSSKCSPRVSGIFALFHRKTKTRGRP